MPNPVFSNSSSFNQPPAYQQQEYVQGYPQQGYAPQQPPRVGGVMTMDDVLAKSAITLLTVFAVAAATFVLVPIEMLLPAWVVGGLGAFAVAMFVSFRRSISPALVLVYAVLEGAFVGAISKFFEMQWPGIVVSAVLATFVTAGATLAAYKFFNIRVTAKFRKMVTIGTAAIAGLFLVNLVLALLGIDTGMRDVGSGAGLLSIGISILAVGLAVFNLVIDFDYIENGIAAQAPASESWRAAFGLTVTMVWLYVEILRILSYFRD